MPDPQDIIRRTRETSTRKSTISDMAALEFGKLPPQARDLEEAVLGAAMIDNEVVLDLLEILSVECFYVDAHQRIWRAIKSIVGEQQPVDLLMVMEQLKKNNDLEAIGGPYYLAQLTNKIGSSANAVFHARIIAEKYIQRRLIHTSSEVIKEAYEDSTDVFDLLDKAEKNLFAIAESNLKTQSTDISSLVIKELQDLDIRMQKGEEMNGVPSGFIDLDRMTGGWQPSDLIILAARPSMGKTAFTLALARNSAVDGKKPVAFFSLEMSCGQLVQRLISMETMITADKIRKGTLQDYEYSILTSKIDKLRNAPIYIDDTAAINIFELRAKCRRLKAQHDIQLIVIDYLQLMSGSSDGKGSGNREQEISQISRSLKQLAKELNVPIIALSQLSRAPEIRGGLKKPMLSDLRESGAIEQDADLVIFLYRGEYYGFKEDEDKRSLEGIAEVMIAKHRNGQVGSIRTRFLNTFAKFMNLDEFVDTASMGDTGGMSQTFMTKSSKMNSIDEDDDDININLRHGDDDYKTPPF